MELCRDLCRWLLCWGGSLRELGHCAHRHGIEYCVLSMEYIERILSILGILRNLARNNKAL